MSDLNDDLARAEADLAATTEILREMGERMDERIQRRDLKRSAQDVRVARLERDHAEHPARMAKLDETLAEVKDIRAILQMMTQRFAGE
jgi:predicted RNase H-like nuclease (RuvC/YqgF family)